jgi:hypothetical protein
MEMTILFDSTGNGNNIVLGSVSNEYGIRAYAVNNNDLIVGGSHNGEDCKAWIGIISDTNFVGEIAESD